MYLHYFLNTFVIRNNFVFKLLDLPSTYNELKFKIYLEKHESTYLLNLFMDLVDSPVFPTNGSCQNKSKTNSQVTLLGVSHQDRRK